MNRVNLACIIIYAFAVFCTGCAEGDIIDFHPNGSVKIIRSACDSLYCYSVFDDSARLIQTYARNSDSEAIEGEMIWYYPSGEVEIKSAYRNGLKHGQTKMFNSNGTMEKLMVFHRDSLIYKRRYRGLNRLEEAFFPIYTHDYKSDSIDISILLPLEQSTIGEGRSLRYCYGWKPASITEDSFILKYGCMNSFDIDIGVSNVISIAGSHKDSVLFGFLFDEEGMHIYDPRSFLSPDE